MKVKAKDFYALFCGSSKYVSKSKYNPMLCGVYSSRKEALDVKKEIADCPLKHTIKIVDVSVEW